MSSANRAQGRPGVSDPPIPMPRVIHLLWSGEIGGAERAVYQLALEQRRSGRADAAIGFGKARGRYCELARENGVPVVDFGLRSGRDVRRIGSAKRALAAY